MNEFFLRNRLHDYVDQELSPEDTLEFENAIQQYPELLKELQEIQEMREWMLEDDIVAPPSLEGNILDEVKDMNIPSKSKISANNNNYWVTALIAAVVLLLLLPAKSNQPNNNIVAQETENKAQSAQSLPEINTLILPPTKPSKSSEPTPDHGSALEVERLEDQHLKESTKKSPSTPNPAKSNLVFEIQTPEDPFIAEWETSDNKVISVGNAQRSAQMEAYQFPAAPVSALWVLKQIATDFGGEVLDDNRQPLQVYTMNTEMSFQRLLLQIPDHRITELDNQLRQIGGKYIGPDVQADGHWAYFPVEVLYNLH